MNKAISRLRLKSAEKKKHELHIILRIPRLQQDTNGAKFELKT